ncbi:hypothetical protein RDI58_000708 [Solanum bulbocastanum]|uniref:Uncharacterized protein n=1 Tax=Solanum bulbocastanum TaxID=147425 RepID=A0AAN8U3M7_SOLBU
MVASTIGQPPPEEEGQEDKGDIKERLSEEENNIKEDKKKEKEKNNASSKEKGSSPGSSSSNNRPRKNKNSKEEDNGTHRSNTIVEIEKETGKFDESVGESKRQEDTIERGDMGDMRETCLANKEEQTRINAQEKDTP